MVATLGPGKFYGSALPRPRIYTDVKFSEDRVDPPPSVVDPLLSWAKEAHWSMGGLSFTRLRLQGRIEGNISKLRAQKEKELEAKEKVLEEKEKEKGRVGLKVEDEEKESEEEELSEEEEEQTTPKAPVARKMWRRLVEESEEEVVGESKRKSLKRKLYDEFDAVAKKGNVRGGSNEGRRISPRTSKNGGKGVLVTPESAKVVKGETKIVRTTNGRLRGSPRLAKLNNGDSGRGSYSRVSRRLVKECIVSGLGL